MNPIPDPARVLPPAREDEIFGAALDRPPAERAAFLDAACAGEAALRTRLAGVLEGLEGADRIFASPLAVRPDSFREETVGDSIGRYKLLQKIGEGGGGVVYMAEQEEPVRRRVALKVIKLGMDTKAVIARFDAERQALAIMEHPNIAKVLDAGATETGRPFFVMELVRGAPITKYCDENHLTPAQRLELFISVCAAIQHAHQKGVIHRDIKPSNILITVNDGLPVPKIIDFGIAKATQGRLTEHTLVTAFEQFIGTPVYMSPEQADMSSLDIDTRSDIYSLGVLLYELLTGRPPIDTKAFAKAGVDEIRHQIRAVEPPKPSTRLSTLTEADFATVAKLRGTAPGELAVLLRGDLDWIVMRCLEKDRTRRYETASSLALDLQRHLRNEPVVARPPSTAYLLGKLIRRHRVGFAAAALITAALVVGATVSTWQAIRATRAEHEATRSGQEQTRLRAIESELRGRAEAQALAMRHQAYASDMNLVQQALALDNLSRVQELLDRQRPKSGETDLRGWEWRYLWQFCQSEATWVLWDKPITATRLSVSFDGNWLAISNMGQGGLWNLRTRQVSPLPWPAKERFGAAVFSPTEPLLALVSGVPGDPASVRITLWNVATRQVVHEWPLEQRISGRFDFSADGKTLIAVNYADVVFWRVPTGEVVHRFSKETGTMVRAVTSDCGLAALESPDASVRLVETATGRVRWTAKVATERIAALVFSPDGTLLASAGAGAESIIRLWDVVTGTAVGTLNGHRSFVRNLVFWPDGRTLASGAQDQTVRLWDVGTRQLKRTLRGHQGAVTNLALLPDNTTLVSSAGDNTVRFWDTTAARAPGAYTRIDSPFIRWAFTGDSQSVITVEQTGDVRRWRGRGFQERDLLTNIGASFVKSQPHGPRVACLPGDHPLMAISIPDGNVQVWNWERGLLERTIATPAIHAYPVAFVEGGKKLLLSYWSLDVKVRGLYEWDLTTGKQTRSWPRSSLRGEYVISPDGRQCLVRPHDDHPHIPYEPPMFNPDRGSRSLIDLVSGLERTLENVTAGEEAARFSPDGRLFAAPMIRSTAVYAGPEFQPVKTLGGNMSGMHGVAFSPDSRRLAVAASSFDAIRLWDTESWEPVLTLEAAASTFMHTGFSPDGSTLGSQSLWGSLHLWRAPSWEEIEGAERDKK